MKKLEKMSLASAKNRLTRNEMRNVMAGSGSGVGCDSTKSCGNGGKCAYWIGPGLSSGCDCFEGNRNVGHLTC